MKTRRDCLRGAIVGASSWWAVPTFLNTTTYRLQAQPLHGDEDRILILIDLDGGNDGLNMVVPYTNDRYYRERETIAIRPGQVLPLDDNQGLHPSLTAIRTEFDEGTCAVMNNVGYPNANRSHFRSGATWHSGAHRAEDLDEDALRQGTGWLGRFADLSSPGSPLTGLYSGDRSPLALKGQLGSAVSISTVDQYPFGLLALQKNRLEDPIFRTLQGGSERSDHPSASPADFLRRSAAETFLATERMREQMEVAVDRKGDYPDTGLGKQMAEVSSLVLSGAATRIYYTRIGGFDTHGGQLDRHTELFSEINGALEAFITDMRETGNWDRTVIMTFSEFGRQVRENSNAGTDHGSALPMFILGGKVKGGIYGKAPCLEPGVGITEFGGVQFETDFRDVYATILKSHLRADPGDILGRAYADLAFLQQP